MFDIKRGHYKNLEGAGLETVMAEIFGEVEKEGDKYKAVYGAMKPITVWLKSKKEICVDIVTEKDVSDDTALKTIGPVQPQEARIVHILDTLRLQEMYISEPMLDDAKKMDGIKVLGSPHHLKFDQKGNLISGF